MRRRLARKYICRLVEPRRRATVTAKPGLQRWTSSPNGSRFTSTSADGCSEPKSTPRNSNRQLDCGGRGLVAPFDWGIVDVFGGRLLRRTPEISLSSCPLAAVERRL